MDPGWRRSRCRPGWRRSPSARRYVLGAPPFVRRSAHAIWSKEEERSNSNRPVRRPIVETPRRGVSAYLHHGPILSDEMNFLAILGHLCCKGPISPVLPLICRPQGRHSIMGGIERCHGQWERNSARICLPIRRAGYSHSVYIHVALNTENCVDRLPIGRADVHPLAVRLSIAIKPYNRDRG
jgi:hypothetical protein